MRQMLLVILATGIISLLLHSCSVQKLGSSLGTGFGEGVNTHARGIGDSLMRGTGKGLEYALKDSLDPRHKSSIRTGSPNPVSRYLQS